MSWYTTMITKLVFQSYLYSLSQEDETSLQGALDLSIKVLSKTLDMTKLTPEKIELATLTRFDQILVGNIALWKRDNEKNIISHEPTLDESFFRENGKTQIKILPADQVEAT